MDHMTMMTNTNERRASDGVADELRRMIISLELPPGAIVSEAYLMKLLDCGRSAVREAILILSQEYLVRSVPGVGISITSLNVADFVHVRECFEILESGAARAAAARISSEELAELRAIVERAHEACERRDVSVLAQLDLEFSEVIARATGNPYLVDTLLRIHRLTTRFSHFGYSRGASAEASWEEHAAILAALEAHDEAQAERLTRGSANRRRRSVRNIVF